MKLTDEQLISAEDECKNMLNGFRNRRIARTYSQFKRGGVILRYVGPRLIRNIWMLIKEIRRLRQEREQMVEALRNLSKITPDKYETFYDLLYFVTFETDKTLQQVGESDE